MELNLVYEYDVIDERIRKQKINKNWYTIKYPLEKG